MEPPTEPSQPYPEEPQEPTEPQVWTQYGQPQYRPVGPSMEQKKSDRRLLLIIGGIAAALLVVCCIGLGVAAAVTPNHPSAQATATSGNSQQVVLHSTATSTSVATIKPTPKATATPQPTSQPKPTATSQSQATATPVPPQATATPCPGVNCNPWGYNFTSGNYISNPPSNFCDYFNCIASFWNGHGYVVECNDDTYSLSGGVSGACSYHGGVYRPLLG